MSVIFTNPPLLFAIFTHDISHSLKLRIILTINIRIVRLSYNIRIYCLAFIAFVELAYL